MEHDAYGWWVREANAGPPLAPLTENVRADVAIIGGGYLGMWSAWHLLDRDPDLRIVLLERHRCGFGPSGRNGGFANSYWDKLESLVADFGETRALALATASGEAVHALGRWADDHGHDIWYRAAPLVEVATTDLQEGGWDDSVAACERLAPEGEYVRLDAARVAEHVRSPVFGGGALMRTSATLQPARLAFALRGELARRGVAIHEDTPVVRVRQTGDGVTLTTRSGRIVRCRSAVLAVNHAAGRIRRYARRVSTASSHIVLTAPVPDVLQDIGWTGGEGVADGRTMLHYLRTTRDGRIAFGWGGGRMGYGGRDGDRLSVDASVVRRATANLLRFFPQVGAHRAAEAAWGGPIDVSPSRLPQYLTDGRVVAGFGFTGNGVAPSWLGGRILSGLVLDVRDEATALPLVDYDVKRFPPEPLRFIGGTAIRAAMVRADDDADAGRRSSPAVRFAATLPRRLGMHLPR